MHLKDMQIVRNTLPEAATDSPQGWAFRPPLERLSLLSGIDLCRIPAHNCYSQHSVRPYTDLPGWYSEEGVVFTGTSAHTEFQLEGQAKPGNRAMREVTQRGQWVKMSGSGEAMETQLGSAEGGQKEPRK